MTIESRLIVDVQTVNVSVLTKCEKKRQWKKEEGKKTVFVFVKKSKSSPSQSLRCVFKLRKMKRPERSVRAHSATQYQIPMLRLVVWLAAIPSFRKPYSVDRWFFVYRQLSYPARLHPILWSQSHDQQQTRIPCPHWLCRRFCCLFGNVLHNIPRRDNKWMTHCVMEGGHIV